MARIIKTLAAIGGAATMIAFAAGGDTAPQKEKEIVPIVSGKVRPAVAAPVVNRKVEASGSECHSGYSGCLKIGAGDYDCAGGSGNGPNYTGRVEVYGSDPFDLDRDNDGWGCE